MLVCGGITELELGVTYELLVEAMYVLFEVATDEIEVVNTTGELLDTLEDVIDVVAAIGLDVTFCDPAGLDVSAITVSLV